MGVAIKLSPDVPVDLALAFTAGKQMKNGSYMYSTTDQRVLFVPAAGAAAIDRKLLELGIKRGERILICQERAYEGRELVVRWNVYKATAHVGAQADGTFIVPAQPGTSALTLAPDAASPMIRKGPADNGNGSSARPPAQVEHAWAQRLLQETNALVDVYAAAAHYAAVRYGDQVAAEDVRELLAAAYASRQNGGCDVA